MKRIAVLGLGNVLMGDDALGPYAVRVLEAEYELPAEVKVLDVGTPGLDLQPYIVGLDVLIFLDTVASKGEAGEVRTYRKEEILRHPPQPRLSPHDPGVKEALLTADFEGTGPAEVFLVGVIPASTVMRTGLSAQVQASVPLAVSTVVEELERHGVRPVRRARPLAPDIWWETK